LPFLASGKIRNEERVRWWEDYKEDPICVFGHYSVYRDEKDFSSRAIYADFAVARRWQERKEESFDGTFRGLLGAVRIPEGRIVYDNGEIETFEIKMG